MKAILTSSLLSLAILGTSAPSALAIEESAVVSTLKDIQMEILASTVTPLDVINWKVGDTAEFKISLAIMPNAGTRTQTVSKDEGTALWVHQEMNIMGQNDLTDMLINKADGKILKFIRNGKETAIPDEKMEIISQDYTQVTVPAGTFKALHIVAKTQQVSKIELWANPQDTVMDGAIKVIAATGIAGDMTMELTSFKHGK